MILNDLFRRYLKFRTLLLYKADEWGFNVVTININSLSSELKLKIVAASYCVPHIVI